MAKLLVTIHDQINEHYVVENSTALAAAIQMNQMVIEFDTEHEADVAYENLIDIEGNPFYREVVKLY